MEASTIFILLAIFGIPAVLTIHAIRRERKEKEIYEETLSATLPDTVTCDTCKCLGLRKDFQKIETRNTFGHSGKKYYCMEHKVNYDKVTHYSFGSVYYRKWVNIDQIKKGK